MKFKLDEHFGQRCVEVLTAANQDVATVAGLKMSGAADADVLEVCLKEGRCLVSLDLDFSNPIRFPPAKTSGIAVVRLLARPVTRAWSARCRRSPKRWKPNPSPASFGLWK